MILKEGRFRVDVKKCFMMKMVSHWNAQRSCEFAFIWSVQGLDWPLSKTCSSDSCPYPWYRGWTRWSTKASLSPSHSVTVVALWLGCISVASSALFRKMKHRFYIPTNLCTGAWKKLSKIVTRCCFFAAQMQYGSCFADALQLMFPCCASDTFQIWLHSQLWRFFLK